MTILKEKIMNAITLAISSLSYPEKDCSLAPPKKIEFGDLSSNIALLLAKELKKGSTIVTILCDLADRYKGKMFNASFLKENNLPVPKWVKNDSND